MSKVSVQTPSVWHPSQHWRISRGKSMAGVGAKTPLLTASLTGNLPLSKKAHTDVIPALCVCASILFKLQNQKVNKCCQDNDQLSRTCHKAGVCVCVCGFEATCMTQTLHNACSNHIHRCSTDYRDCNSWRCWGSQRERHWVAGDIANSTQQNVIINHH